jgi:hypothetical protein
LQVEAAKYFESMSRQSKYISLSNARDCEEYAEYRNEIRTVGIFRRVDQIRERHGDRASTKFYRQHVTKYEPELGPLNNAVRTCQKKLIILMIHSGKRFDSTLILSIIKFDLIMIIRLYR